MKSSSVNICICLVRALFLASVPKRSVSHLLDATMDADSQVVAADAPAAGAGGPPQVNLTTSQLDAILDWHANEMRRMHTELNAKLNLKGLVDGVLGPSISYSVEGIVLLRD